MNDKLYFAYGSNINLDQMAHRCPDALPVGPVMLENYELLFRGSSENGGVATIRPKQGSYVYGLLWKLTPPCEKALDFYEGWPNLYRKESLTVFDANGKAVSVMAYVMNDSRMVPSIPWESYYNGIHEGFLQNNLPVKHLEHALEQVYTETARQKKPRRMTRKNGKEAR